MTTSTETGLDRATIARISHEKDEPEWMRRLRLRAYDAFAAMPAPGFVDPDLLRAIGFWSGPVPPPPAQPVSGPAGRAHYESEAVFRSLRAEWASRGVVFLDTDAALREHPDLVREHFGTVVPPEDGKLAALNAAVWSGGSFVSVPAGVVLDVPLQAFFKTDAAAHGQFERTIVVVGEGASVHYVEGCTAPVHSTGTLHASVVEIVVRKGGRCRFTTIQNWTKDVSNLVTKRAVAGEDATVVWVDANVGSKLTVKHPSVRLAGAGARGEVLAAAFGGEGQHQDIGGEIVHAAPGTSGRLVARALSKDGGRTTYRGRVEVAPEARGARMHSRCDALMLDGRSSHEAVPDFATIRSSDVRIEHEATVAEISEDQLLYMRSRGIGRAEATVMIANGFMAPIVRELPMEYAVELYRLVQQGMEHRSCAGTTSFR